MRIAVIGAGALGLYYGALLQKSGNDVRFLLRSDYDAIMARGLQVYSPGGNFHLERVQGYRSSAEMGPVDLVLVGLKTFANQYFDELISPLMGDETLVLTLQNGLGNEEALAALFGDERVLGGVAFLCSNRGEPGVLHHMGQGRVLLGEFLTGATVKAERVAEVFRRAGVTCTAVQDLRKARWEKLVWNIPFNGLCALMMKPVDTLLGFEKSRQLVRDVMGEVVSAANAQELTEHITKSFIEEMIRFSDGLGPYRPSMQIDREEGRPLELEAIIGRPLDAGKAKGVQMPRIEALLALLELGEHCRVLG